MGNFESENSKDYQSQGEDNKIFVTKKNNDHKYEIKLITIEESFEPVPESSVLRQFVLR